MNKTYVCFVSVLLALTSTLVAQTTRSEGPFRAMTALTAPKPAYPPALLAKKTTGVVVASVLVGTTGKLETVVVLEAPDPLMAESVRVAVMHWTFRPTSVVDPSGNRPITVASKLTFYFQIRNGQGVVLNPDEMPGGPRWTSAPAAGPPAGGPPTAAPAVRMGGHDISGLEIDKAEFDRRAASTSTFVLDPRDRDAFRQGHHAGAVNIPRDELLVRAPVEIPAAKSVVVDCSQTDDFTCMVGALSLTEAAFKVSVFKR